MSNTHSSAVTLIPCYNVELFCKHVVEEVLDYSDQIILVNDGSTDETAKILYSLYKKYPEHIHFISFEINQGKGAALLAGLHQALARPECEIVITFDGDGQHDASYLPQLEKAIRNGADLAIGTRDFSNMPFFSRLGNSFSSLILRLIYPKAPRDTQSGMRALSRPFAQAIVDQIHVGRFEMEFACLLLALKQRRTIASIPIPTTYYKKNKHSHFSKIKDSFLIFKKLFVHLKTKDKS